MRKIIAFILLSLYINASAQIKNAYDVCVYGGTSSGVIAAYTAAKMKKKVLLIEPGRRLGGLSSGGLGFTDIGNKYVVTGLALDFYRRIGAHYNNFEQWIFEPKVAEQVFKDYVLEGKFDVLYHSRLREVKKNGTTIASLLLEDTENPSSAPVSVAAKVFLDCTYEGDLMARAGVSYTVGREANAQYNETVNGVQLKNKHQFPDGIDPYKVPGDPSSGLLWGISSEPLAPAGTGDKKVQAYNYRICLTSNPDNRIPITRPANYDSTRYELLLRYLKAHPTNDIWVILKFDHMPNNKTDINNNGPFSTDMIGMNHDYPNADYDTRALIIKKHEEYTKGLLYFIGHDPRMPESLRKAMLRWGYPKDEYVEFGNWSPQLYVREARRMLGEYVMTEANCQGKVVVPDEIGRAAYAMDSHNAQRVIINGMVKNEGDVQYKGISPYPIAYRSIIPKASECSNLLVPVCLSASHMAYGSIRMEPVFMVLGQSAGAAAVLSINSKRTVQRIDVANLQRVLRNNPLADNSLPEIIVDNREAGLITKTGNWKVEKGGYGPDFLTGANTQARVRFSPVIPKKGNYTVYTFYQKVNKGAELTEFSIQDGKSLHKKIVKRSEVNIAGQTSGDWVKLGTFSLSKGNKNYIEISGSENGAVVADAILLVPEKTVH